MKKAALIIVITFLTISFFSCKKETKKEVNTTIEKVEVEKTEVEITKQNTIDREPTDDELREIGIVKKIEDGTYPMFIATIEFPSSKYTTDFDINVEAMPQENLDLYSLIDKYVIIYYTDNEENILMDLYADGKSLSGENTAAKEESLKNFTGILAGAESVSGDLPNTISITNKSGAKINFDEFITPEIIAQNGKTVTGYYYSRYVKTITYIIASED